MVRKWQLIVAGVMVLIAVGVYVGREQVALARIGTAFAAKQTCSCLFVSGRSLNSCRRDYNPDVARWFTWRVGERSVTVSVLGIFSSTSVFESGFGCHVAH